MAFQESTGIAIEWVVCALAFIFVLLRIYARYPAFGASEYLTIAAWILHCIGCTVDSVLYAQGFAPPPYNFSSPIYQSHDKVIQTERSLQITYADLPLQYMSLWSVKMIFLFLYYQLILSHLTPMRISLHIVTAAVASTLVVSLGLNFFWCLPVKRNWDLTNPNDMCFSYNEVVPYWATFGFHLATDLMIYILPFPLLNDLRISRQKRYGVIFLFSLGFFSVLCTVARGICSGIVTTPAGMVGMFGAMEQGSGIIVSCCPALKKLLFASDEEHSRRRKYLLPTNWARTLTQKTISIREKTWRSGSSVTEEMSNLKSADHSRKGSRVDESTDHPRVTATATSRKSATVGGGTSYDGDHDEERQ